LTDVNVFCAQPPPSFQPALPPSATGATATGAAPAALKQTGPDLIQRYNLAGRIVDKGPGEGAAAGPQATWSSSKTERQSSLQKRREEMILAARRKMLEKD
jgi:coupling of ubiquitin conjugation to ER degradation protein 1